MQFVIASFAVLVTALLFAPKVLAIAGIKAALLIAFPEGQVRSGKSGTTVFMKNGRQRIWVKPALVRNVATARVRSLLASLSTAFRSLTQSEIKAWNDFSFNKIDRIGRVVSIKGKAAYVQVNTNLTNIGSPTISDPPSDRAPVTYITVTGATVEDTDAGLIRVNFDNAPADCNALVFATAGLSPGVSRPSNSAYRLLGTVAIVVDDNTLNCADLYKATFGVPVAGSKVFFSLQTVSESGQASAPGLANTIVVPA